MADAERLAEIQRDIDAQRKQLPGCPYNQILVADLDWLIEQAEKSHNERCNCDNCIERRAYENRKR